QFVLKGSVRWGDGQIRLSLALLRLPEQEIVWAEQIDAPQENVFSVQDQIVGTVAGRLAIQVDEAKLRAARGRKPEDLQAYDCWLRGMACLKRGTLEGDQEAREFFQQALRIDPAYPRAYSGLSLSHFNEWSCQAWHLWEESGPSAFDYASKAVELDDTDAMAHSVLGRVCRFRRQHRQADHHAARALALNPSDAHVLIQVAVTKLFGCQFEESLQLAHKAGDLNPLHGPWYAGIMGWSLFMLRRYAEARQHLSMAGEAIVELPAYRAACAVVAGEPDQARLEYETFLGEYRNKIAFGRQPDPEEPLSWAVQVEPFRSLEASRLMPDILRDGGIAEIDVERVLKSRSHLSVRPAEIYQPEGNAFVRAGELWSLSYRGKGALLVEVKGFHDIARLLSQPGESVHCLELSGAAPSADTPQDVLSARVSPPSRGAATGDRTGRSRQ
ncbi:MAG TPA: hypothetical protein VLV83_12870, partial [Acidobacteriota bacterium]|nr:hypothetical protein [Acidobacteriota bacterium]